MKDISIKLNKCDCELLLEALKNNDLSIIGEQSIDQIIWSIEDELKTNL
jgi:hypothetical protein